MKQDEPGIEEVVTEAIVEVVPPEVLLDVATEIAAVAATPAPEPLPATKDARCSKLESLIAEVSAEVDYSYAKGELQRCVRALTDALYWHERNIVVKRDQL
jgi:hypothetical protein